MKDKRQKPSGNQHFLLGPNPKPGDTRPRNAFGVIIGFGAAYNDYYAQQEREQKRTTPDA